MIISIYTLFICNDKRVVHLSTIPELLTFIKGKKIPPTCLSLQQTRRSCLYSMCLVSLNVYQSSILTNLSKPSPPPTNFQLISSYWGLRNYVYSEAIYYRRKETYNRGVSLQTLQLKSSDCSGFLIICNVDYSRPFRIREGRIQLMKAFIQEPLDLVFLLRVPVD